MSAPYRFERAAWRRGLTRVAGVDEAGRGPLAGPVVAAAVVLAPGARIAGVDDSKRLEPEEREDAVRGHPRAGDGAWAVGIVDRGDDRPRSTSSRRRAWPCARRWKALGAGARARADGLRRGARAALPAAQPGPGRSAVGHGGGRIDRRQGDAGPADGRRPIGHSRSTASPGTRATRRRSTARRSSSTGRAPCTGGPSAACGSSRRASCSGRSGGRGRES